MGPSAALTASDPIGPFSLTGALGLDPALQTLVKARADLGDPAPDQWELLLNKPCRINVSSAGGGGRWLLIRKGWEGGRGCDSSDRGWRGRGQALKRSLGLQQRLSVSKSWIYCRNPFALCLKGGEVALGCPQGSGTPVSILHTGLGMSISPLWWSAASQLPASARGRCCPESLYSI